MLWVWAFAGLSSNDASKQPEEKGQFVAATGVSNPVKQTNDDVVSLDNEHQQNGNQQYNHCQNQDWVNDPKGELKKVSSFYLVPFYACIE